jgi:hypothetical protein
MEADKRLEFMYVVVTVCPPKVTTDEVPNAVPAIPSEKDAAPAVALAGLSELIVGCELAGRTVKGVLPEFPPPPSLTSKGFVTETWIVPGFATSEAEMEVETASMLMNVVVLGTLLIFTVEPLTKLKPLIVIEKAGGPARTLVGASKLITGGGSKTLKATPEEFPPPGAGLETKTVIGPIAAIAVLFTTVVSNVEFTNVVGRTRPPKDIVEVETKFVPLTVSVNVPEDSTA